MVIDEASMHEYKSLNGPSNTHLLNCKYNAKENPFSQAARCQQYQSFREVRKWVGGHQDTVRREDLQVKIC